MTIKGVDMEGVMIKLLVIMAGVAIVVIVLREAVHVIGLETMVAMSGMVARQCSTPTEGPL